MGLLDHMKVAEAHREEEYGPVSPELLESIRATFNDFSRRLFTPLRAGRGTVYTLIAQTVPGNTVSVQTGLAVLPTSGQLRLPCPFGTAITHYEVWNYDAANGVVVTVENGSGAGLIGAGVYVAANSYYVDELRMNPEAVLLCTGPAGTSVQLKMKGF